jgi:hypothetical protein
MQKIAKELSANIDPIGPTAIQKMQQYKLRDKLWRLQAMVSIWQRTSNNMPFTAACCSDEDIVEGVLGFCSGVDLRGCELVNKQFNALLRVNNPPDLEQQNSNRLWYHVLNREIQGKPSNVPFFVSVNYKRMYVLFRVNYFR